MNPNVYIVTVCLILFASIVKGFFNGRKETVSTFGIIYIQFFVALFILLISYLTVKGVREGIIWLSPWSAPLTLCIGFYIGVKLLATKFVQK